MIIFWRAFMQSTMLLHQWLQGSSADFCSWAAVQVAVAGANAEPPMPTPSSINSVTCVGGVSFFIGSVLIFE